MIESDPTLPDMIAETVRAYCAQEGGGIPLGFLFVMNRIGIDGKERINVATMEDQSSLTSTGLAGYMNEIVKFQIEDDLLTWADENCTCDDEECD